MRSIRKTLSNCCLLNSIDDIPTNSGVQNCLSNADYFPDHCDYFKTFLY